MTYERNLGIATCALALWIITALAPVGSTERGVTVPHLVICEVKGKGTRYFFWLDKVEADGSATYITPSGLFGKLSKDGIYVKKGEVEGDCGGKNVKELMDSGQARFLLPPR